MLSLTEILCSIKDLLKPKHMKCCSPNSLSPSLSFLSFLLSFRSFVLTFSIASSVTLFFDTSHLLIITANTELKKREMSTDATPACACLPSSLLPSWRLLAYVQSFTQSANISTNTQTPESSPTAIILLSKKAHTNACKHTFAQKHTFPTCVQPKHVSSML